MLVFYLEQQGGLTAEDIQHLAATKIQQYWRKYKQNKILKLQQFLMLKHESLRRDKAEIRHRLVSQSSPSKEINVIETFGNRTTVIGRNLTLSTGTQTWPEIGVDIHTQTEFGFPSNVPNQGSD